MDRVPKAPPEAVRAAFARACGPGFPLEVRQIAVLAEVAASPGRSLRDMGALAQVLSRAAMCRAVAGLRAAGLVEVGPPGRDRRLISVSPTASGRALLASLAAAISEPEQRKSA